MQNISRIFICYRQVDGKETAHWLYENLHGRLLPDSINLGEEPPVLDVYFDQATPAIGNWQELHRPYLESSRAMLVICTPGIFSRLNSGDWVHKEIEWWLENRSAAPIIIDTTGEDGRWIPLPLIKRWPNAQRLQLSIHELQMIPEQERLQKTELLVQRIIGGITASEATTQFEDLENQKASLKKQKRYLALAFLALLASVIASLTAFWFAKDSERVAKSNLATSLIQQATNAWDNSNSDFAKILSTEALIYDQSQATRDGAAAINYWYAENKDKAVDRFERILKRNYTNLLNASAAPHRSLKYAHSLSIDSLLSSWLTLTRETNNSGYDWVLRLKGLASRIERSIHIELRHEKEHGSTLLDEMADAAAELARVTYHNGIGTNEVSECNASKNMAATKLSALELQVPKHLINVAIKSSNIGHESWKDIQSKLNDDEVLIDYQKYRDRYVVWLLTSKAEPRRIELGSAQEIEALTLRFSNLLKAGYEIKRGIGMLNLEKSPPGDYYFVGTALRKIIWEPIRQHFQGNERIVYIVPDSAIAAIPFSALPSANNNSYLLDEGLIFSFLTSAMDIIPENDNKSGDGVLLVGGVVNQKTSHKVNDLTKCFEKLIITDAALPPLPGTLKEVMDISIILPLDGIWKPYLFKGEEASEETVRKNISGRKILHFATHAWFAESIIRAALPSIDADTVEQDNLDSHLVFLDPTLRAGLHLGTTDVSKGFNDGVLSAPEVADLDLSGVDMVVLSGCDTAGSASGGNDLIGLASSFREAGAKTVVASLYSVSDSGTPDLMANFYKFLIRGDDKVTALHKSMEILKNSGQIPYVWAAFVVYGPLRTNESPKISIESKASTQLLNHI